MGYKVSIETLEHRYREWKYAMLLNVYQNLGLDINVGNPDTYEIDSVLKYNILISGLTGLLHTRFRGEAQYHENPCLPLIARKNREYDPKFEISEVERFKDSFKGRHFLNKLERNDITWWMLAQHYMGFETRLLDITRNSLIALYFACEKRTDRDGFVYVFHSTDKTSIPLNKQYLTYQDHIVDGVNYYLNNHFVYMRPTVALDRISKQEGEFLWIKNYDDLRNEGLYETNQIIPIIIRKENKAKLMKELNDPQGINREFLDQEIL